MSGAGFDMVGGTQVPLDFGIPGAFGGSDDGDDLDSSEAYEPMSTNGCGFCGYAGGDCMAPGPDCQLAKKMLKPIPHPTPVYYSEKVEPLPPEGPAAEGVWVSYGLNDDDVMYGFAVHRNELEALRVAVDGGFKARFLNYDDVL